IPVLASFITTDIDMAQGVKTNLANLLTVIPKTTNLATDSSSIIYDTTIPDTDLNGQASLPYGGYLGVGFLSNFDYDFYSPAPARSGDSYQYSQGVRYDLFGSALQAHLTTQVRDIVYLNYYDADENNQLIVPQHQFIWFPNVSWNVPVSNFPHYQYGWQNQTTKGNTINVSDYYHIQSTVTYDYYGMDGVYLGQESTTGLYGHSYSVNVPYNFGNYYIEGSTTRSGLYPKHDETLNVYYKYVPPIIYYNTSNPYATTYYANGYEYVPNYIPPVVYYVPTYDSYGYGGGYSYSGGYAYSSGGYSSSSGAYYPNYVPQSAYYSKEAQLVAEEGGNNSSKVNYSTDKEDNSLLNFGESVWSSSLGESLKNVTRFAPWQISSFVDYGTQIVSGEDANDALNKTAVHAGLSAVGDVAGEYVAEEIGGMLGTALAPGVGTIIGIGIGAALGVGFDFIYDKIKKRRR
ncbi:cell wall anchor protein, partial [Lactococcus lactis]|nr:cell wall anchor protein [Lactococcus lactis]